jgi:hypothetical protein
MADAPDFQNNNYISINNLTGKRHGLYMSINAHNLIVVCVYVSVRHSIEKSWLNDRDQFLYPEQSWLHDFNFQNNCLIFCLFHGQNRISTSIGINHWIPFTEQEVNARGKFASNFMTDFMRGKIKQEDEDGLFGKESFIPTDPLVFSPEAQAVFEAGKALWIYYHAQPGCNVNASLYDIREHFQGRNDKGKMNTKSDDKHYMELIGNLRASLKVLADAIAPNVYEYGFLKE